MYRAVVEDVDLVRVEALVPHPAEILKHVEVGVHVAGRFGAEPHGDDARPLEALAVEVILVAVSSPNCRHERTS